MQTPVASESTTSRIAELAEESGLERVHMLAWRDLDDDEAGGSEVHAHSIASIWTQSGLRVTMRTSHAAGRPPVAVRTGYAVSRRGSRYSVFPRAAASEVLGRMGPCDGLVEIWNGVPFLSPLWWRGPSVVWLHHVHGVMWTQTMGAVGRAGILLEERLAPPFYRRRPIVTLSPSSKDELVGDLGFREDAVTVIPPGTNPFFTPGGERSATPLLVAVGRLTPVKDFPRLVRVAARARELAGDGPGGLELVVVGEGYSRPEIEAEVDRVGGRGWVHLPGRVSDDELLDLYRRAWLATSASTREGWGMTLTEAAACGTPAVASDIPGHADAVAAGRSGLLAHSDEDLAAAIAKVVTDPGLRAELSAGALARAAELSWDASALANFEVLAADARHRAARRRGLRRRT